MKRTRQYISILAALAAYYLVHEGAHLLYALLTGVFKQINFMGLGVQDTCWRHWQSTSAEPEASCCARYFIT